MKVKICGITRLEDLKSCEEYGADYIGFINIKRSKRYLDINKVGELASSLTDIKKAILVIEPEIVEDVEKKVKKTKIKTIQLYSLSSEEIAEIKKNNELNIIRAIGLSKEISISKKEEIENFAEVCDYLLFDSMISGKTGGTGTQIPLEVAVRGVKIAKKANPEIKIVFAGGMNVERIKNESELINEFFDYIDVNSGVEDKPGIKNHNKVKEILKITKS